jgi:hypothetical protein
VERQEGVDTLAIRRTVTSPKATFWPFSDITDLVDDVRSQGRSRHVIQAEPLPFLTDAVEKVENRKTPKISRKSFFRHCYSGKVLWSQYEGRWLFSYESMWVLRSPRANRISGFKIFVLHPKKNFSTASTRSGHYRRKRRQ